MTNGASKSTSALMNPKTYDLNRISTFTTVYETLSSVVVFSVCDLSAQHMEGRKQFDVDRTVRGTIVNLATGGGAMYWYWWLWLDAVFPGTSIGTVCLKAALDTFLYSTAQNFLFLYIYSATREGSHEAGIQSIKDNSLQLNLLTWVTSFPTDVACFYVFGWWRELVSESSSIATSLLLSYWANRHVVHTVEDGSGEATVDDMTDPESGKAAVVNTATETEGDLEMNLTSALPGPPEGGEAPDKGTTNSTAPTEAEIKQFMAELELKVKQRIYEEKLKQQYTHGENKTTFGSMPSKLKTLKRTACGCIFFWKK
jgi:hypothetical protein